MKKHILTALLIMLAVATFGQQWVAIKSDNPSTIQTSLVSSTESQITVNLQVPGFYAFEVTTPRGEANIISVPRAVSTAQASEPNLPMIAIPAIVGDRQHYGIRVVDAQYTEYQMEVAPSKGDFPRSIDPADVPYTYGEAYSTDAFFPAQNVGLYDPYILRDFRGQNMVVYPFAYNPVTHTLRVYYNMTVEMYSDGLSNENIIDRRSNEVKIDPEIKKMYESRFINYSESLTKYTPMDETGELLIICHDAYMEAMQPFVDWKKQIGRPTTMVGTSTSGFTSDALKTYIQAQYDSNPSISHILLVGEASQIQGYYAYNGGYSGRSDNWYGQLAGNDFYNDVIVGRFSAENEDQVTTQVNKVIHYERDINASDTWLVNGCGVAATAGGGGHFGEDDWEHLNNIRDDLMNYHYATVYQEYYNTPGYSSTTQQISDRVNSGVGIINYCNHGNQTAWQSHNPYYSNSHVNALTNDNMLPFIWSVACLNGQYDYSQPCFAETWLRATNNSNGNPTGAIGGMFSYISQPWVPPMYGQDEMVDVLIESHGDNIKRTLGGISFDGNMKIIDQYGTSNSAGMGTYMCWILFGDPSLTVRTDIPTDMGVTHASTMSSSATSFIVNATNGDGALATLTLNNEILGSAIINNGSANITFTAPGQTGTATLTVFGYNKITYVATIDITQGGGPDPISLDVTANPSIIAQGESAQLNAIATGGNGSFTYIWSPRTGLNNPNIQNPTASPNTTTTYTCTVSSGGQTATGSISITVVTPPSEFDAEIVGEEEINLSWTEAEYADYYNIYRQGVLIADHLTTINYTDNYAFMGIVCYELRAIYQNVYSEAASDCVFFCVPPIMVEAEYVWNNGDYFAQISWRKDVYVNTDVERFRVFRKDSEDSGFELIGEVENIDYVYDYQFDDTTAMIGSYEYMVSATYREHDCEEMSDPVSCEVTDVCENTIAVKVYPNPTKGEITLEGEALVHIRVVNAFGQTVYNAKVEGDRTHIDLSRLAKGIYMMHIEAKDGQTIRKIVVE